MRSNTSLLGRVLLWIALQARHPNYNLKEDYIHCIGCLLGAMRM